ncbi:MAG: hypothetical protein Q9171_001676 [Xanthocarpia ochracea]
MIDYWSSKSSMNSVAADTRIVSLHVMSGAIFGKSYPFRGADQAVSAEDEEHSSSYSEALRIILDRCTPLVVLGRKNLDNPLFRDFKVKPVPLKGEDDDMARARLLDQIQKETGMRLLLQMLHPEKAVLKWTKR